MAAEIKQYKGRYTGPQIDDLLERVPKLETRVEGILNQGSGDVRFTFQQTKSDVSWNVYHGLGKKPAVTLTDTDGMEFIADVKHLSENELVVYLGKPMTGYVILN